MKRIWLLLMALGLFLGTSINAYADCRGCCSYHGGVVCRGGVTKCADGSSLSSKCRAKGCNKCGSTYNPPEPEPEPDPDPIPPLSLSVTPSATSGTIPLVVNWATYATGGQSPYFFLWDFGDGSTSTLSNPTHTYIEAQEYTATVTISDVSNTSTTKYFTVTAIEDEPVVDDNPGTTNTIKIAAFNIQIFGQTKASNDVIMGQLAKIITEFDIVAIQEIRDISETAIEDLESLIDQLGINYDYVLGPRLGRTSSKEQYAYIYQTDRIAFVSSYTYDDSDQDIFHREPLIGKFKVVDGNFDFVLLTIHTDPDEATKEINALPLVISDVQNNFPEEQDIILMGDLNADCDYFDEEDFNINLRNDDYIWLVDNTQDTNVSESTSCTYDRIIITDSSLEDFTGMAGVFRPDEVWSIPLDEVLDISDHYPVWAEFYIDQDTDADSDPTSKYQSSYELVQWSNRGNDTFYCIDLYDENWSAYHGLQDIECGENLHSWSPKQFLNGLGIPDGTAPGFKFNWRVRSSSGDGGEGFEGQVICK